MNEPTQPVTIRQLCERATPGPWRVTKAIHGVMTEGEQAVPLIGAIQGVTGPDVCRFISGQNQEANAEIIARLSPATVLAVVEALEHLKSRFVSQVDGITGDTCLDVTEEQFGVDDGNKVLHALALLNGTNTGTEEKP